MTLSVCLHNPDAAKIHKFDSASKPYTAVKLAFREQEVALYFPGHDAVEYTDGKLVIDLDKLSIEVSEFES